jgi:hypothetical protein
LENKQKKECFMKKEGQTCGDHKTKLGCQIRPGCFWLHDDNSKEGRCVPSASQSSRTQSKKKK